ncbi:hypothetical protein KL86PLE_90298 [uncultured Pleomorphomonas sp.]|uniref:Uncharacterized protein n=1 Tax=uncultured Pleomorphomonas sp. TaxID=442121 RepID=A0A212LNZ0_9HYPH|nr:hypothetical protein KL86PLE_90298 [uncultured Pleomorphomonas sp.]
MPLRTTTKSVILPPNDQFQHQHTGEGDGVSVGNLSVFGDKRLHYCNLFWSTPVHIEFIYYIRPMPDFLWGKQLWFYEFDYLHICSIDLKPDQLHMWYCL